MLTLDTMRRMWPRGNAKVPGLIEGIVSAAPSVFAKYGIKTPLVVAHAMAQFSHECGAGLEMVENIHYTAKRAAQVWPRRFANADDCYKKVGSWPGDADFPGKLIDSVYGTRMGNRPGTHDGRNFIGRGLAQTTGREGYEKLSAKTGIDFTNNPDWVSKPGYALEAGVADFVICGCVPYAEKDDIDNVTLKLNGGHIGLAERKEWLAKWKAALESQGIQKPIPVPASPKAKAGATAISAGAAAAGAAHEAGMSTQIIFILVVIVVVVVAAILLNRKG